MRNASALLLRVISGCTEPISRNPVDIYAKFMHFIFLCINPASGRPRHVRVPAVPGSVLPVKDVGHESARENSWPVGHARCATRRLPNEASWFRLALSLDTLMRNMRR